ELRIEPTGRAILGDGGAAFAFPAGALERESLLQSRLQIRSARHPLDGDLAALGEAPSSAPQIGAKFPMQGALERSVGARQRKVGGTHRLPGADGQLRLLCQPMDPPGGSPCGNVDDPQQIPVVAVCKIGEESSRYADRILRQQ